ncbi:MAG: TM1812 family CRISPR-associated protein [Lachnospiraceae bacterium]|nr:TM1812 family CRISPR-associated protein [Lachnospiraceae bacterium]
MNNTTENNVLILGMSTFNQSLQLNHYYADSASGKHYRFDGVSQLEAGTKYYINYLAEQDKKLDKIIILNTSATDGALAKCKLGKDVNGFLMEKIGDKETISPFQFYLKRIKDYLEYGDIKGDYSSKLNKAMDESGLSFDEMKNKAEEAIKENSAYSYGEANLKKDAVVKILKEHINNKKKEHDDKLKADCLVKLDNNAIMPNFDFELMIKDFQEKLIKFSKDIGTVEREIASYVIHLTYDILDSNNGFAQGNDRDLSKLQTLYKDLKDDIFHNISLEKVENNEVKPEDMVVHNICQELLKLTEAGAAVNVYVDVQGGDRTFIQTVNAAIDLLGNRNVEIKDIVATEFDGGNVIHKVKSVSSNYAIYNLVSGMEAFVRYGKADELVAYVDRIKPQLIERCRDKLYDDAQVNEAIRRIEKLVSVIKSIDDAIQTADVVGFRNAVEELKGNHNSDETAFEILNEDSYEDPHIKIIVEDIKREYSILLQPNSTVLDMVEWLNNKGFTSIVLTLIEGRMPKYFIGEKEYITLTKQMDYEDKKKIVNPQIAKFTPVENIIMENASDKCIELFGSEYRELAINAMLELYVDKNYAHISNESFIRNNCATALFNSVPDKNEIKNVIYKELMKPIGNTNSKFEATRRTKIQTLKCIDNGVAFSAVDDGAGMLSVFEALVKYYVKESGLADDFDFEAYYESVEALTTDNINPIEDVMLQKYNKLTEGIDDEDEFVEVYSSLKHLEWLYTNGKEITKEMVTFNSNEFFYKNIGGKLLDIYKTHPRCFRIDADGYAYRTLMGIKNPNNTSIKDATGEIGMSDMVKNNRRIFEEILLIQHALKQERHNTNHATEKVPRLSNSIIRRIIGIYIRKLRELEMLEEEGIDYIPV